jgi:hypothetical protein
MAERKQWVEQLIAQGSGGQDTAYNFDDYEHNYRYDIALYSKWKMDEDAELTMGGAMVHIMTISGRNTPARIT